MFMITAVNPMFHGFNPNVIPIFPGEILIFNGFSPDFLLNPNFP